jgi:hypothetical protein
LSAASDASRWGSCCPSSSTGDEEDMTEKRRLPRVAENYRGFDIWYDPVRGQYYASHCEHTRRSKSVEEIREWLDREKM